MLSMDANGVLNAVYIESTGSLRLIAASEASVDTDHTGEENGVWSSVFDSATNSLRAVMV